MSDEATIDQWFSATGERLPCLDDGWVLIVIDFNEPGISRAIRLGYYDADTGIWRTQWGRVKDYWIVTHWRPLPELPGQVGQ